MSAVAFSNSAFSNSGNPPSFAYNSPTGSDRLLLVGWTDWAVNPLSGAIGTGFTYNGVGHTAILDAYNTTPSGFRWGYLIAPATGSNTLTITGSAGAAIIAVAMTFTNVHQTVPVGTPVKANGVSTTATVNVTGTNSESLIACVVSYFGPNSGITVGAGQSNHTQGTSGNSGIAMSTEPGNGGTVTMSETWTTGTDNWAIGAVELFTANPTVAVALRNMALLGVGI